MIMYGHIRGVIYIGKWSPRGRRKSVFTPASRSTFGKGQDVMYRDRKPYAGDRKWINDRPGRPSSID